jgi:hypothetical protein
VRPGPVKSPAEPLAGVLTVAFEPLQVRLGLIDPVAESPAGPLALPLEGVADPADGVLRIPLEPFQVAVGVADAAAESFPVDGDDDCQLADGEGRGKSPPRGVCSGVAHLSEDKEQGMGSEWLRRSPLEHLQAAAGAERPEPPESRPARPTQPAYKPAATAHGAVYWLTVGWWWGPSKWAGRMLLWLVFLPLGIWRSLRHHRRTVERRVQRGVERGGWS